MQGLDEPWTMPALTCREKQVINLIAKGLTNSQIAVTLFISCSTVKSHVAAILEKLNVSNRIQAVIRASQLGLVPWPIELGKIIT